jgi:hypothetical protein
MNKLTSTLSRVLIAAVMLPTISACFTGVDSTPKITAREIKKRKIVESAEKQFLADVTGQKPSAWQPGKRLFVTDNRISLIFTPLSMGGSVIPDSLAGTEIVLTGVSSTVSVTGDEEVQLSFLDNKGNRLSYRPGVLRSSFDERAQFEVPFTVEMSVVDTVSQKLVGNTYYILTSRRYDAADGNEIEGLRYIPVTISRITPGNANQPLRVFFTDVSGHEYSVLMTIGNDPTSTHNFDTLFAFDNPRTKYNTITDRVWGLIMRSEIEIGMTSSECRLALGAPNDYTRVPTTGGMVERWTYDNGVYLMFEDGVLTRYRK